MEWWTTLCAVTDEEREHLQRATSFANDKWNVARLERATKAKLATATREGRTGAVPLEGGGVEIKKARK